MPELTHDETGVLLAAGSEDDPETLTPAQAQALAAELLTAAASVEVLQQANRERCARDGHDWYGFDTRNMGREVFLERCERPGCDAEQETDGWRGVYPPKTHHVPVGSHVEDRECYGPGCHYCCAEEFGRVFREFLDVAGRGAEAAMQQLVNSPPKWPINQTDEADAPTPPQPKLPDPGIPENPHIPPPSRRSTT